jgi:hypothetical protein
VGIRHRHRTFTWRWICSKRVLDVDFLDQLAFHRYWHTDDYPIPHIKLQDFGVHGKAGPRGLDRRRRFHRCNDRLPSASYLGRSNVQTQQQAQNKLAFKLTNTKQVSMEPLENARSSHTVWSCINPFRLLRGVAVTSWP